jgi:hypothetical protein
VICKYIEITHRSIKNPSINTSKEQYAEQKSSRPKKLLDQKKYPEPKYGLELIFHTVNIKSFRELEVWR